MNGYLVDTNVVSELVKSQPEMRVIAFLSDNPDLWLSVVTLHEMRFGLHLMPRGRRREDLSFALSAFVAEHDDRILPVNREDAAEAAILRANCRRSGRTLNFADALIAGTAKANDLILATRNVSDFERLGVEIINPWIYRCPPSPKRMLKPPR